MKICNVCKAENKDNYMYCQQCGSMATGKEETLPDRPPEPFPTEPSKVLAEIIMIFVKAGYQVVSQTETTAQLFRKKKFSRGKALAFGLLYVASQAGKKDQTAFVSVNPDGSYQVVNEEGITRQFKAGERLTIIE